MSYVHVNAFSLDQAAISSCCKEQRKKSSNLSVPSKMHLKYKAIMSASFEKEVLTNQTNLSRFCLVGTTPVLAPNV